MSGDLGQPVQANDWRPRGLGGGWPWVGMLSLLILGVTATMAFVFYRNAVAQAALAREAAAVAEERFRQALMANSAPAGTQRLTEGQLLDMINRLSPWPSFWTISEPEMAKYVEVAKAISAQGHEEAIRLLAAMDARALESHVIEGKLFLLMRFVFDLPERAKSSERRAFKGWVNWPKPDANGFVSLSWPIGWEEGKPKLLATSEGAEGGPYRSAAEYRFLMTKYKRRY